MEGLTHSNSIGLESQTTLESLGEVLGEWKAYDSALPIAEIDGTRIVKCLYKADSEGKRTHDNVFVRVPTGHITEEVVAEQIAELAPYLVGYLQEWEDKGIKKAHRSNESKIYTEYLSLQKVVDMLEESEQGARLNKDKIEKWFTDSIANSLLRLFAGKMGITDLDQVTPEQVVKIELVINAYLKKFCSLASGKTFLKAPDRVAMVGVIEKCEAQNTLIGKRFISRLESMEERQEDMLLAL